MWVYGIRYALEELAAVGCCQVLGLTILFELQLLLVVLGAGLKHLGQKRELCSVDVAWVDAGHRRESMLPDITTPHHTQLNQKDMSIGSGGRS